MDSKKKKNIFSLQTFTKNNVEPRQNFSGFYEKSIEVVDELQDT